MKEAQRLCGVFTLEKCRGKENCPNAVIDTGEIIERITAAMEQFDSISEEGKKLLYHQVSRIAVAGCPNACSQPQIKDVGLIGKIWPKLQAELCTRCGLCIDACRERALSEAKEGLPVLSREACIGCGDCIKACPCNAFHKGEDGLQVVIGGKLGRHPVLAEEILPSASVDDALEVLSKIHTFVAANTRLKVERFSSLIQKEGIDVFKGYLQNSLFDTKER